MKNILLTLCCAAFVLSCGQANVYDVTRFGAKGDGVTDDAAAIQKTIDKATENGGTVVFPSGKTFLSGPIELKGHVEYRFEPGSVLPIHRHRKSSETVVILRGHLRETFYDPNGQLTAAFDLIPGAGTVALNIPLGQWHTAEALKTGTVILEMKDGPYEPLGEEDILEV